MITQIQTGTGLRTQFSGKLLILVKQWKLQDRILAL